MAVEHRPALHVLQPDAVAGPRQVAVADEVAQPGQRRPDLGRDRLGISGLQPRPVGFRNLGREIGDRPVEAAALDAFGQHRVELLDDVGHDQPGLHHARRQALLHPGDRAVGEPDEIVEPGEAVLIVLDGLERRDALAGAELREEGVEAVEMVDRPDHGGGEDLALQPAQVHAPLPFEDVVGDLLVGAQRGAVDARRAPPAPPGAASRSAS